MKTGIIGRLSAGKTTLFSALKINKTSTSNIETVKVPDQRIDKLADIFKPKKVTYSEIVFVDIPGKTNSPIGVDISTLKDMDVLVYVSGVFSGADLAEDINAVETEFILSDMELVQNRLHRMKKENKSGTQEYALLERCQKHLDKELSLRYADFNNEELKILSIYRFLSIKEIVFVANIDESQIKSFKVELPENLQSKNYEIISFSALVEVELTEIKAEERGEFLSAMGIDQAVSDKLIRSVYNTLGLISFLTAGGDKEVRAWSIRKGSSAWEAAGKIHSDIQKGFIRAEVIAYDDFIKYGSFYSAKEKGVLRLEGKQYEVKDGDIITFRFNV